MTSVPGDSNISNIATMTYERFMPEPKNGLKSMFSRVMSTVGGFLNPATLTSSTSGIDSSYVDLLNKQIETQTQMQVVSMESNVEKSKHETQMAAIRNVRVG